LVENRISGFTAEIVWHRRETRRQIEKTNFNLWYQEKPVYSTHFNKERRGADGLREMAPISKGGGFFVLILLAGAEKSLPAPKGTLRATIHWGNTKAHL
jgi:hypothetical protein